MCRKYFFKINADQQDSQGRTHETDGHKPRCSPPYRNQDFSQLVCQFLIHKRSGRTATSTVFLKKNYSATLLIQKKRIITRITSLTITLSSDTGNRNSTTTSVNP